MALSTAHSISAKALTHTKDILSYGARSPISGLAIVMLYSAGMWYRSRVNRRNRASDAVDSIQPSFDKLSSDADIRRFAQMYSNQTPLPTSAIAERRITVV